MKITQRLGIFAAAVALIVGGTIATAAPAQAALLSWHANYSSSSACWSGVNAKVTQLLRYGQAKSIHLTSCHQSGSTWRGTVSYNTTY